MADRISEQCFDIAVGLYACSDSTIKDCGEIRQLVAGVEDELLAARAEVERLRGELREALALLRAHGQPPDWVTLGDAADWNRRYGALLARYKETP